MAGYGHHNGSNHCVAPLPFGSKVDLMVPKLGMYLETFTPRLLKGTLSMEETGAQILFNRSIKIMGKMDE